MLLSALSVRVDLLSLRKSYRELTVVNSLLFHTISLNNALHYCRASYRWLLEVTQNS